MLRSLFNSTSHMFIHHIHCYYITCNSCPDTWMKSKILSCVGTSTWEKPLYHTAHLLPLSPHTSSNHFASKQISPCSALAKWPFSGPQPSITIHQTMPATCLLTNGTAGRPAGAQIKSQLPSNMQHSKLTTEGAHIVRLDIRRE